jgi:hypothetical protein
MPPEQELYHHRFLRAGAVRGTGIVQSFVLPELFIPNLGKGDLQSRFYHILLHASLFTGKEILLNRGLHPLSCDPGSGRIFAEE